ncbi:receptor-like protein 43 [Rosa chinensis]|uniref:receptor-like protein 43 n=1 Tax=Rosa chinensis TaxID=74649 RepID=UPI001AD94198|nr:receptor-like protein 43 [Rosa chinensis]
MKTLLCFFLFLITLWVSIIIPAVHSRCIKNQQRSLLQFKKSLVFNHSTKLSSWNASTDCCSWVGVTCSSNGHVLGLDISSEHISAGINNSSSLFHLHYLQSLSVIKLDGNNISAPVPGFFANFSNLTILSLQGCNLHGTFPKEIFQLPSLQSIDLSYNQQLDGSLPEFPMNGSLRNLHLRWTKFSGLLPNSIGNLKMLSTLNVVYCNFTGPIPKSITNLTQLVSLSMSHNKLEGSIPSFSGVKNVVDIDLSDNGLTGTINSTHWRNLTKLSYLSLGSNKLDGNIPASLFSLPLLGRLVLSSNQFSGPFAEISNVSSNLLYGLDLSSNNLEGPIPMSIFSLQGLINLDLSSNNFGGSFPPDCLHQLRHLSLRTIPNFLRNQSVINLDLSENQISSIPNWIWSLNNLESLHLSWNSLDNLEVQSVNPTTLVIILIDFSCNKFKGSIPKEIGELISLETLNLSNNAFTGEVPSSLSYLSQLHSLDLSRNKLSGQIPPELTNLTYLAFLNLSYNRLVGRIPNGARFSTFDAASFEGNKGLWGPPLPADKTWSNHGHEIDWDIICPEIGFTCGFGIVIGSLLFCKRWRKWYYRAMYNMLLKIFPQLEQRFGHHRRHVYVHQRFWRR